MLLSLFHEKSIFDYSKIVTCIGRPQKIIGLADNPVFHFLLNLLFLIENCIIDLICFMGLNVPNFNSINFEAPQKYWLKQISFEIREQQQRHKITISKEEAIEIETFCHTFIKLKSYLNEY